MSSTEGVGVMVSETNPPSVQHIHHIVGYGTCKVHLNLAILTVDRPHLMVLLGSGEIPTTVSENEVLLSSLNIEGID